MINELKNEFLLKKDITYLNFGSFGACPKEIFNDYQKWQLELEEEPAQFITVNGLKYLKQSREALAKFIHCNSEDIVLTTNPSYAVNIIAKSLELKEGDEVLATHLEYGACDKTWDYYCKKKGAKYIRQNITLPIKSKEQIVNDVVKGITSKTKAIFISHITSTTSLILPVKEICEIAQSKGILTFVDGAHVPGQLDLNLEELQADIYTGACHKWMMTPKGCSFLYVKREIQHLFDPLIVSWGYNALVPSHSKFLDYHQMQGTRDFSAFLTIPEAIRFMKKYNWKKISQSCRELVILNAKRFCDLVGSEPLCPLTDEFIGQLFSIPILTKEPETLQRVLFEKYKIEIPVMRHNEQVYLRYSINAFNNQKDLNILYDAVKELIHTTDLIKKKYEKSNYE